MLARHDQYDKPELQIGISWLLIPRRPGAWKSTLFFWQEFTGKQADQLLTQMVDDVCNSEMEKFASQYNIDLEKLKYVINHYDPNTRRQIGLRYPQHLYY